MYLISHRGNLNGAESENENNPKYLIIAINKGFNVEVDVRFEKEKFYLGHDFSQYEVNKDFLLNENIWCHAKTHEALLALDKINAHYFWHQEDDYTITSKGFFWTFPGKELLKKSICVLPEKANYKKIDCLGICSDFIERYRND
tara:strand:+ start:183 stop:614 length:432 start_codon:yes stop_codon:yes gene_type:complete